MARALIPFLSFLQAAARVWPSSALRGNTSPFGLAGFLPFLFSDMGEKEGHTASACVHVCVHVCVW